MIHHKMLIVKDLPSRIEVDKIFAVLDWPVNSEDQIEVTTFPADMDWTATRVDTGDGVFFTILPASGTGADTIVITAGSDNNTGSNKVGELHISDDLGVATTRIINVTQTFAPI